MNNCKRNKRQKWDEEGQKEANPSEGRHFSLGIQTGDEKWPITFAIHGSCFFPKLRSEQYPSSIGSYKLEKKYGQFSPGAYNVVWVGRLESRIVSNLQGFHPIDADLQIHRGKRIVCDSRS